MLENVLGTFRALNIVDCSRLKCNRTIAEASLGHGSGLSELSLQPIPLFCVVIWVTLLYIYQLNIKIGLTADADNSESDDIVGDSEVRNVDDSEVRTLKTRGVENAEKLGV